MWCTVNSDQTSSTLQRLYVCTQRTALYMQIAIHSQLNMAQYVTHGSQLQAVPTLVFPPQTVLNWFKCCSNTSKCRPRNML
jgi:hypothetical protein